MKDKHYVKIIEKVKIFVGKIDGDDVNEILRLIDDLVFEDTSNKYFELIDDFRTNQRLLCRWFCQR